MLVICKLLSANDLPEEAFIDDEDRETNYSNFLSIGEKYNVYGLMFGVKTLDLLICRKNRSPYWMPSVLFNVLDSRLQPNWQICLSEKNPNYVDLFKHFGIISIIGYKALIEDYEHYAGILERDPDHLKLFFDEKNTMDTYAREYLEGDFEH